MNFTFRKSHDFSREWTGAKSEHGKARSTRITVTDDHIYKLVHKLHIILHVSYNVCTIFQILNYEELKEINYLSRIFLLRL